MTSALTEHLRSQSDQELAALLRARPDLVVPVPADLPTLAARAQSRSSVARVLDRLNRFELEILDALRYAAEPGDHTSLDQVLALTALPPAGVDPGAVRAAVRRLQAYLLVYGPEQALRVVPAVAEVLGPYPAGLGRPADALAEGSADLVADPARLRRTLLSAPPAARAVLERLAAGPPVGTTTEGPDGESPVAWLVSRGLLAATSETTVELPREVGLLLRRDTGPLGALHPQPPAPRAAPVDRAAVDAAGAGQAMEAVRLTGALLAALADEPATLRSTTAAARRRGEVAGRGIGVRDLRRLARTVGVAEPVAALLIETAYAAGLIGSAEGAGGAEILPAAGYDAWHGAPLAGRWHTLVTAWLAMTRQPGLAGERDARDRIAGPLSPALERSGAPATRRAVLSALAALPPGSAPTAEEAVALVRWHAPRRVTGREAMIKQVLAEAAVFGLIGRTSQMAAEGAGGAAPAGALTSYAAALLAEVAGPEPEPGDDPLGVHAGDTPAGLTPAGAALDALLPAPVSDLLVQADLTVVVPGPPEPTLAAELDLVTEHESAGGASVHRVTRDSLRRALDAGYAAEDLHALFARRSRTPVPQALSYLIDDVARAHGGLRTGSASAYLRSDDEALVAQVLADRRLTALALRRLAPTVLVSPVPAGRLLAVLRDAGYAPVAEDARGAPVLVGSGRGRRAPARPAVAPPTDPLAAPRISTPRLLGIVEDIRRGDAVARAQRRPPAAIRAGAGDGLAPAQAYTEAMAVLQQAVRDKLPVWVRYVDAHGQTTSRLLRPVSVGAGYLRAEDERTETLHTFALHRITAAALDDA
ncbi:MAG TPA: helicase-associated domain-containing protein [Natronosporangium sp.]|nr:helicase-associated domain-containing protein [Natronosporangium sp.]